jgi:hypothetical protein
LFIVFLNCESLSSISFESSSLSLIESKAFTGACLRSVSLPGSVVFIAGDAFPCSCEFRISTIDSCQEFNKWKEARQSGSTEAFEWHRWKQSSARKEWEWEKSRQTRTKSITK